MLDSLPGWVVSTLEHHKDFTPGGFQGLLDHHSVTNGLGEQLARGSVSPDQVQWLLKMVDEGWIEQLMADAPVSVRQSQSDDPTFALLELILKDPRSFWQEFWSEQLSRDVALSAFPRLKDKTTEAARVYRAVPIAFPKGFSEDDYPSDWIKPAWGRYVSESQISKRRTTDRWVVVETIDSCNWNDQKGYGKGSDPLGKALGLSSRFRVSFDDFMGTQRKEIAKLWGCKTQQVRLPSLREWNIVAQVLLELSKRHGTDFANWGESQSWEWCSDKYSSGRRLLAGARDYGGLSAVHYDWSGHRDDAVGFRALAVL